jgi:predicted metalloendopeptidase
LKSQCQNQDLTVERRDRRKSYNPMTVADLQKLTPSVWKNYFTKVGYTNVIIDRIAT